MQDFFITLRLVVVSMVVCCVIYTAGLLGFGQLVMPWRANGSLIRNRDGLIIGSELIAQNFTKPGYFWPRPSAAGYDAAASTGSNLSPTNAKLRQQALAIIDRLGPLPGPMVPADLVTASGSGLDPHISLAAALFQAPRVAAARKIPEAKIKALIAAHTDSPTLNWFGGEPLVNVFMLNLAVDELPPIDGSKQP